ncbi:MAG: hypothetical protein GWM88_06240 [Pseudomonadales bacterium]|nr:hypothetical protein [Pseudomonadales bacterium]NIX07623.1 hypothetical protein [Pseudomonadales bacterium]
MAVVLLVPSWAAANRLYRFLDADGQVAISHSIPSDRVKFGYEVVDAGSGRVIEVVEAQKSPEEIARLEREAAARKECEDALDRVYSVYQSEIDIENAEAQTLESLEQRIANAEFNLERAQRQKEGFEATAARLERSGKALDESLISNIERSQVQVDSLETEIVQRRQEQEAAKQRFTRDRVLFRQQSCVEQTAISAVTETN